MGKIIYYKLSILGATLLTLPVGSVIAGESLKPTMQSPAEETQPNDTTDVSIDYDLLEEFEITAKAKTITSDGRKLTYNADEDPSASGKSVLEMLRNVPMVTVDGEDKIKLNGKEGVRIYVNGKEEPMLTANASRILKAMPGSAVSKIEVIHEPGAKYDAEGNAGIINLITERKQSDNGYAGSVRMDVSNQTQSVSGYATVKQKNVTVNANIDYSDSFIMNQKSSSLSENTYLKSGNVMKSEAEQDVNFNYLGGGLNLSFEPNQSNLFTASGNIYNVNVNINDSPMSSILTDALGNVLLTDSKIMTGSMKNLAASANIGYQHSFANPRHSLIVSYKFDYGKNPVRLNHDYLPDNEDNSTTSLSRMTQSNRGYTRENTAQIDYSLPLSHKLQMIEVGAKTIMRDNSSYTFTQTFDSHNNLSDNDKETFRQFQDIYAVYAAYSINPITPLSINAGVRYEHTHMGGRFKDNPQQDFSTNLNDIVPNAGVTYMFSPSRNLRLAYQMRISRPSLDQVNPFMMQMESYSYRAGNSSLTSEHSNTLTLTYTEFGRLIGGNIGVELFRSNNMIESINYFDGLNEIHTFANIGFKQSAYLTGFLTYQITPAMSVFVNGRVGFNSLKSSGLDYRNHGWQGNINAGWTYSPEKIGDFSIYGGYSTPNIALQGKNSGWYYYQASASRAFLADKSLKLTLYGRNFFQSTIGFKNTLSTHDVMTITHYNARAWAVGMSIEWSFGNYKGQVKQLATSIENNDRSTVSSKGQSGI